jgi:hypothetical protein
MPAVAELDGGYEPDSRFFYGAMRTYFEVGDGRGMEAVVRALRAGRTFVTSGPIVLATIDGHPVGSVLPSDGAPHTLRIEAYASGDRDDALSYVLSFRNGRVHRLWDLRERAPRRFEEDVTIRESERAWYVVKAYGKEAPDAAHFDVSEVCRKIVAGSFGGALAPRASVALTSPFYFRPSVSSPDPTPLESHVRLRLVNPKTGRPVERARVVILLWGQVIGEGDAVAGRADLKIPLGAVLQIRAPGHPVIHRSLYLDYAPHRASIEELATGRWLDRNNDWRRVLKPGQLPWEAFRFDETKAILADVDWVIALEENERDGAWRQLTESGLGRLQRGSVTAAASSAAGRGVRSPRVGRGLRRARWRGAPRARASARRGRGRLPAAAGARSSRCRGCARRGARTARPGTRCGRRTRG